MLRGYCRCRRQNVWRFSTSMTGGIRDCEGREAPSGKDRTYQFQSCYRSRSASVATRAAPNRVEPAWEVHARVSNGLRGQRKALEESEVLARARLDPAKAYDMSSAPSRRGGHSLRRNCSTSKIPLRRYTVRSMRQKTTRSGAEAYPDQRMVSLMSVRQKRMQSAEAGFS